MSGATKTDSRCLFSFTFSGCWSVDSYFWLFVSCYLTPSRPSLPPPAWREALAQDYNIMALAKAPTWAARSRDESTNHALPLEIDSIFCNWSVFKIFVFYSFDLTNFTIPIDNAIN